MRLTMVVGFALTAVWVSNVVPRPPAKRAAAIGIVNGIGNLGNLCVFAPLSKTSPRRYALHSSFTFLIRALYLYVCAVVMRYVSVRPLVGS